MEASTEICSSELIIFVQNDTTQTLLKTINIHNTTVTGDTRFDRVYEIAQNAKKLS